MGCGQSVDSAYSSRYPSAGQVQPWARNVNASAPRYDNQNNEPVLDKNVLEEYMQVEKEIAAAHQADPHVMPQFKAKMAALEQTNQRIDQLEQQLSQGADAPEYSTAKDELAESQKQKSELIREVDELKDKVEKFEILQMRQDTLLARMFGGAYGSQRESQLEQQLDMLEAQRARIMEANFKWRQAQMMMEYACRQLAVAVQKWQNLSDIPTIELEIRYTMPTDARDHLMAAAQRQKAIDSVPYNDKMDSNNKEMECVFEPPDSDDPEANKKQLQQNHEKASSLLRWFEQVLNTTIMQDLAAINRQVRDTTLALKEERIRLIKQKVREIWGSDVQIEIEDGGVGEMPVTGNVEEITEEDLAELNEQYMAMDDLGPLPTTEELFGKSYEEFKQELDSMREQHETEMSMFLREQDKQAAKTRGDLQAKLEARRRQRAMRNLEMKQRHALATGATVS